MHIQVYIYRNTFKAIVHSNELCPVHLQVHLDMYIYSLAYFYNQTVSFKNKG